jgi:hypothetical protein
MIETPLLAAQQNPAHFKASIMFNFPVSYQRKMHLSSGKLCLMPHSKKTGCLLDKANPL